MREIKKLFIMLVFASFSSGMIYGFQELWMQNNNLSISTIGTVLSICSLLAVSVVFLCSNIISQKRLKNFELLVMILKFVCIILLFLLNGSGYNIIIKFLIMLDHVLDVEIFANVYPMISIIKQNDKLYARKDLIYKFLYYIALLVSGFILGKKVFILNFSYNSFILIAAISLLIAIITLCQTNLEKYYGNLAPKEKYLLIDLVKKLSNDKISIYYIISIICSNISYYAILGLLAIIFMNYFGFSSSFFSVFSTLMGILAVVIGSAILEKFTFKNNYLNVFVKFGGRLVLYVLIFIFNSKEMYLIAIIYTLLFSESYVHVVDAPYINRYDGKYQLAFCSLKEMAGYLGTAIGTFLCGFLFVIDIKYNFLIAFIFGLINVILRYIQIYLRKKEDK